MKLKLIRTFLVLIALVGVINMSYIVVSSSNEVFAASNPSNPASNPSNPIKHKSHINITNYITWIMNNNTINELNVYVNYINKQ